MAPIKWCRTCVICKKRHSRTNENKRKFMARFPLDEDRCKQWVKIIGNEDFAYIPIEKLHKIKYVCGDHFEPQDFNKKRSRLKKSAVPSMFLNALPLSDHLLVEFPFHIAKSEQEQTSEIVIRENDALATENPIFLDFTNLDQAKNLESRNPTVDHDYQRKRLHHDHSYTKTKETLTGHCSSSSHQITTSSPLELDSQATDMPVKKCCVVGCDSRTPKQKLFNLPHNDKLLEIWLKCMETAVTSDFTFLPKNVLIHCKICELHFEDKYINADKSRQRLAIPTLFTKEEIETRQPKVSMYVSPHEEDRIAEHTYTSRFPRNTPSLDFPEEGEPLEDTPKNFADNKNDRGTSSSQTSNTKADKIINDYLKRKQEDMERKQNQETLQEKNELMRRIDEIEKRDQEKDGENQRNKLRMQKEEERRETARQLLREQLDGEPSIDRGEDSIVLHRFPNPYKDHNRFRTWTFAIGGDIMSLDDNYVYKYRRVCHKHFDLKYLTWSKMLSKNAVPTLHLKDFNTDNVRRDLDKADDTENIDEDANNIEYDDVINNTDFGDDDDQEMYHAADEEHKEDRPFSWQKCTKEVLPLDEKLCAGDDVMFCGEAQLVPDLYDPESESQDEFSCNVCNGPITGLRYTCVQCRDWDLCAACEARGQHAQHYVLRVPPERTHTETQSVLAALRQLLDGLALHEEPDLTVVKHEVKTEDPLGDGEETQELTVEYTGQASQDIQEEIQEEEHLDSELDTNITTVDDVYSIKDAPTNSVPRKRKIARRSDDSDIVLSKIQKHNNQSFLFHNDENTKLVLIEKSQRGPELPATENVITFQTETSDVKELQTETDDFIALQTDTHVIAPQEETDNCVVLQTGTSNVIALENEFYDVIASDFITLQAENDNLIVLDDNIMSHNIPSNSVVMEHQTDMSEMSLVSVCTDTNEIQYMTLDGQVVEVIDCSRELHVNVTRLSEDQITAATQQRRGKS